jgi:hypothetical protein
VKTIEALISFFFEGNILAWFDFDNFYCPAPSGHQQYPLFYEDTHYCATTGDSLGRFPIDFNLDKLA